MKRDDPCPACGRRFKGGKAAWLLSARGGFDHTKVCQACAETGALIVLAQEGRELHVTLAPFARHLRRLAKIYEANGDERSVGLEQAAGVLEVGRVPQGDLTQGSLVQSDPARRSLTRPLVPDTVITDPSELKRILSEPTTWPSRPVLHKPGEPGESGESGEPGRPIRQKANGAAQAPPGGLPKCDRAILSVLVQRGAPATRAQLAILSGYSSKSGAFGSALARLRAVGYIANEAGRITATAAGKLGVGHVEPLPKGDALVEFWCDRVGVCGATILQAVLTVYPEELPRAVLAERTGYSAQSGAFGTALARLRALELMTGTRASDAFARAARGHLE